MVGTVYLVRFGGNRLAIKMNIEVLCRIRLNGNGTGVDKNAPLNTVAVADKKEDESGRRYEKGEGKRPKEHSSEKRTHREEVIQCQHHHTTDSDRFPQALTSCFIPCTLEASSLPHVCFFEKILFLLVFHYRSKAAKKEFFQKTFKVFSFWNFFSALSRICT
jgi:hypothetical protein